jgi:hypothetical protein
MYNLNTHIISFCGDISIRKHLLEIFVPNEIHLFIASRWFSIEFSANNVNIIKYMYNNNEEQIQLILNRDNGLIFSLFLRYYDVFHTKY